jgi:hypothetical protein
VVEFFRSGQAVKNEVNTKAESGKNWKIEMKLTGTLIESLMARVERAEQKVQSNRALAMEPLAIDSWLASVQENNNQEYDSQLFGVA